MLYQSSKRLNQLQERCILLGPGNLIEHYHANNFMCLNVVRLHPQLSWVENIWKPFLWSWAINKLAILGITVAIRRYSTGSLAIDRSSFPYVRYRILISSLWGTTVHSESTWNLHSKGKKNCTCSLQQLYPWGIFKLDASWYANNSTTWYKPVVKLDVCACLKLNNFPLLNAMMERSAHLRPKMSRC